MKSVTSPHSTRFLLLAEDVSGDSAEDCGVMVDILLEVRPNSRLAEPKTRSKAPVLGPSALDSRGGVGGRTGLSGVKLAEDRVSSSTMAASAEMVGDGMQSSSSPVFPPFS